MNQLTLPMIENRMLLFSARSWRWRRQYGQGPVGGAMPDGTNRLAKKALQSKAIERFLDDNDF
jgi:hypothetical protein